MLARDRAVPSLDVLIATFNRAEALGRLIESVLAARRPPGLAVRILVADNNSTDATRATVSHWAARADLPIAYIFEPRQGKPYALNAGIAAGDGDLIAFLDDDERVLPDWLEAIDAAFRDDALDFIVGRCVADWLAPRPHWLPSRRLGIVGAIDFGEQPFAMETLADGSSFLGGVSVVRRPAAEATGGYAEWLTYGEDSEFGMRLIQNGARGRYDPALRVHHEIPGNRLTRAFLRRRTMMNHVSMVSIVRRWPGIDRTFLGFPYAVAWYRLRAFLGDMPTLLRNPGDAALRFEQELRLWDIWGLLRGWSRWDRIGPPKVMR